MVQRNICGTLKLFCFNEGQRFKNKTPPPIRCGDQELGHRGLVVIALMKQERVDARWDVGCKGWQGSLWLEGSCGPNGLVEVALQQMAVGLWTDKQRPIWEGQSFGLEGAWWL